MAHHFFIPPTWLTMPTVTLQGAVAQQISQVLRLRRGEQITVFDNTGRGWQVELTEVSKKKVMGQIIHEQTLPVEPRPYITLYQGMLKKDKFEWVLQKGTELGLSHFVPLRCQRAIIQEVADINKKLPRWELIIQEAAEQSGRAKLPTLAKAMTINEAIAAMPSQTTLILPWEEAHELTLKTVLQQITPMAKIALFIGPEGGFTANEAALVQQAGGHVVTLGPRILRAETASLAATAAILYELGAWS